MQNEFVKTINLHLKKSYKYEKSKTLLYFEF